MEANLETELEEVLLAKGNLFSVFLIFLSNFLNSDFILEVNFVTFEVLDSVMAVLIVLDKLWISYSLDFINLLDLETLVLDSPISFHFL